MTFEIGIWRVDGTPRRIEATKLPLEETLEDLVETDPSMLGEPLLFIGRQVATSSGKFLDLLAIDRDGCLRLIELKRDKTPREVVAQVLDYGSWVETLEHDDILAIFEDYRPGSAFEAAFAEQLGTSPPEELNTAHQLTIVASELDGATSRIIQYLARFEVPLNVLFFRHFTDDDRQYLARSWLLDTSATASDTARATKGRKEPWNGVDWYVSFGEDAAVRSWDDARRYGFVSAGGGDWYSATLRNLPVGARVSACIPGTGYVGVGTVSAPAVAADEAELTVEGEQRRFRDLDLDATYDHGTADPARGDAAEYIVPVDWSSTVSRDEAVWEKGFFANQNSACKLRNRFTLDGLAKHFDLHD